MTRSAEDATTSTVAGPTTTTVRPTPRTIIVGGTEAVPDRAVAPAPVGTGSPGGAAIRILRASGAARVRIEVAAQPGAAPPQAGLDHLSAVLREATGKPVEVTAGGTPPDRTTWSAADLRSTAAAIARPASADTAVLRLLFVHGTSDAGQDTLGLSVASDVVGIFPDRIADAAVGLASPAALTDAVTVHEVGHLLGLVDLVLRTGRADKDHPGHSTNPGSVMYWAVESSLVGDLLTGGPPRDFDDRDRADLAAIRRG